MARHRTGPRGMLLHASIVALAAATTSLWLVRTSALGGRVLPRIDGLGPAMPRIHVARQVQKPVAAVSEEPLEVPPSLAISAPTVLPEPAVVAGPPPEPSPAGAGATAGSSPPEEPSAAPDAAGSTEEPPAPAAVPVSARVVSTAYLRTGPSNDAILSRSLPAGTQVSVLACTAACSWLLVQTADGYQAWSAAVWYSIQGSLTALPAR